MTVLTTVVTVGDAGGRTGREGGHRRQAALTVLTGGSPTGDQQSDSCPADRRPPHSSLKMTSLECARRGPGRRCRGRWGQKQAWSSQVRSRGPPGRGRSRHCRSSRCLARGGEGCHATPAGQSAGHMPFPERQAMGKGMRGLGSMAPFCPSPGSPTGHSGEQPGMFHSTFAPTRRASIDSQPLIPPFTQLDGDTCPWA